MHLKSRSHRKGLFSIAVPVVSFIFTGFQWAWGLSIQSYVLDNDGITCKCNTGIMKVKICQDDIVNVVYTPTATFPTDTSLSVNKIWSEPSFTRTEAGDTITLQTSRIKVKVSKATAAITYTTLDNTVILSEYNKSMTATTVQGVATYTINTIYNSPAGEGLYGLGQHMKDGGRGTPAVNYKGYGTELMDQYYSGGHYYTAIPLLVSTRGYGVFWDNYSKSWFQGNEGSNTRYSYKSECGNKIDYYFFYGPGMDTVISRFRTATGKSPLLPKWSYGLIQSKDRYNTQAEVIAVKNGYRNNKIAVDCIVQDWRYWEPNLWGSHTFNASRFPNPKVMVDSLHRANIHSMISIWPVFQAGSTNYNELNAASGLWTSQGTHRFVDAYSANARAIYWRQIRDQRLIPDGWDAWWCDNTEPLPYPDGMDRHAMNTAMGKGAFFYNTYSLMLMLEGYNRWRTDITNKRVAILSRSGFAGQQRTGAITWNNDIQCNFGTLANSIPVGLQFSLSGNPNWCTDIGGYWGHDLNWTTATNRELFTRWFQYGAFCSIFRIHGGGSRELYSNSWDATTKSNLLVINKLRYRLMPYVYSLAWKVSSEDYTMQRHLAMDFQNDPKVYNIGNQFMFGPALLVSPVTTEGATSRSMYFPSAKWYNFWNGTSVNGSATSTMSAPLSQIPLFVRAGSIIPMGPEIQYATERSDTIELRIYPGADGAFTIYEDEGNNYNYETGKYSEIPISYNDVSKRVTIGTRRGSFTGMDTKKVFNIVVVTNNHGIGIEKTASPDFQLVYNGTQISTDGVGVVTDNLSKLANKHFSTRTMQNVITFPHSFSGMTKEVRIFNITGKLVAKSIMIEKNGVNLRKDFRLSTGMYLIKVDIVDKELKNSL